MPADYMIDAGRRAVFTLGSGTLSILDLLDHMTQLQADPQFSSTYSQIADFRGVELVQLSSADIRSLAKRRTFDAHARRALIVGTTAAFDPARAYAAERNGEGETHLTVVHDLEKAAQWTGIDLDAAKQAFAVLTARMQSAG